MIMIMNLDDKNEDNLPLYHYALFHVVYLKDWPR